METQLPNPVFLNVEYIFFLVYRALARFFHFLFGGSISDPDAFGRVFYALKFFATILVILLITIILYCLVRLYEIKQEDTKKVIPEKEILPAAGADSQLVAHSATKVNETWNAIRAKLLSDNPSEWRLAIIEADIYLDKVLDQKGYFGDTLSDKFKQITPEKLPSIQIAWEAHKVRNRIAHDGADFILTMPEARRVLSYFEIVFRDLEVIE